MTTLVVHPAGRPLFGSVPVAGDAVVAQHALVLAALAPGTSTLRQIPEIPRMMATRDALQMLGVAIDHPAPGTMVVHGAGLEGLRAPARPIEVGAHEDTLALFAALAAPRPFTTTLVADDAVADRSVASLVAPLRARGARIRGRERASAAGQVFPPLVIGPRTEGAALTALDHDSARAAAPVKAALLVSGLLAQGPTRYREPVLSRDDTERLLLAMGAPIRTAGAAVELDPAGWNGRLEPFELAVPGDFSAAAFFLVAGLLVEGSRVTVRDVAVNPTRAGLLAIARDMGAGVARAPLGERQGEPVAELSVAGSSWHGTAMGGEPLVRAIDDLEALGALAARAHGSTRIATAFEVVARLDRLRALRALLGAFGVDARLDDGALAIEGSPRPLAAADFDSAGDGALAMSACVLALAAEGPSRITRAEGIAAVYPRFVATLRALGARIDVEP